jgi:hypothetical protein
MLRTINRWPVEAPPVQPGIRVGNTMQLSAPKECSMAMLDADRPAVAGVERGNSRVSIDSERQGDGF